MTAHVRLVVLAALLATACGSPALGEEEPESKGRFTAMMFGDAYWFASSHRDDVDGQSGAWVRRIYLTYDRSIDQRFDARVRLEAQSQGRFETTSERIEPFFKDVYLRWNRGSNQLWFGLSPAPTWEFVEKFWGYRSLERTVLDLQGVGESRDLGVAWTGTGGAFSYHLMIGNGAGVSGETNTGKAILGAGRFRISDVHEVELYADFNDMPGGVERSTVQGVWAIRLAKGRVGVQLAHQEYSGSTERDDFDAASVFGVLTLNERVALVGRYDRTFDPNPGAEEISFLPMDATAESNFVLAAVDITVHEAIHVLPNVEAVLYSAATTGEKPSRDIVPRITLSFEF